MKLTVLGSGGSEGVPVLYCKCKICTSGEQRLRPSYHLKISNKSELLIEAGLDFRIQQLKYNFDFTHCFLSHEHIDHIGGLADMRQSFIIGKLAFDKDILGSHPKPIKKFLISKELHKTLYAMKWTESVGYAYKELIEEGIFSPIILKPNEFQKIDDFEILILYNFHGQIISNGFILKSNNKVIIYLADMSTMDDVTRNLINKIKPDLLIFHIPAFYASPGGDHINIDSLKEFYQKYKVLINHFSHESGLLKSEMEAEAKKIHSNLVIGYDGLTIDIGRRPAPLHSRKNR